MELQTIVDRYAEAIAAVDPTLPSPGGNTRTGDIYRPGFKSYGEEPALQAIDRHWAQSHPDELLRHALGVRYPAKPDGALISTRTAIDHVITTEPGEEDEWGIEVKRLQAVGDNGKENGYSVAKMLSPYLADRGLLHDALRLREYSFTRRVAVIGFAFEYDSATIRSARQHFEGDHSAQRVIDNIAKVIKDNGGHHRPRPLIEFADAIMGLRGLTKGGRAETSFEAWTHPAGGVGLVFGWEIRVPAREPDYDPRHPW